MEKVDFLHRTRLVFGQGEIARLGELARQLGATRALVVSDPGVVSAGHFQRGVDSLRQSNIEFAAFHGVRENPTTREVEAGLQVAKEFKPELLVGLGVAARWIAPKGSTFCIAVAAKWKITGE